MVRYEIREERNASISLQKIDSQYNDASKQDITLAFNIFFTAKLPKAKIPMHISKNREDKVNFSCEK